MKFKNLIEIIKKNPKVLISVNHPVIDEFASSLNDKILPQEYRWGFKKEIDEGLGLDDLMVALGNNFLPGDLIKIFDEGDFILK